MKNNTAPSSEIYAKIKQLEAKSAELKAHALGLKEKAALERRALLESFVEQSDCGNISTLILELRTYAREKNSNDQSQIESHAGRPGIAETIRLEAKSLLNRGKNPKEVSKKLGISIATIYNLRRELPAFAHAA